MEITGDNESRKPAVDTHDQGISDQPIGFDKPDVIINAKEGASEFAVNNGQIDFKNVDKVWIYTTDGRLVNFQTNNVKSVPTEGLSGTYLIRMQSGQVMRTRKIAF